MNTKRAAQLLFAVASLVLGACQCGAKAPPVDGGVLDSGLPDVDAGQDAGVDAGVRDAGQSDAGPPPELKITRLLPPRGPSTGGTSTLIEGSGFLRLFATTGSEAKPVTKVKFGTNQVIDLQIIDDETMEVRVPPGAAGPVSVSIQNPNGAFICTSCFTWYDELVVTGFAPREGSLEGGNEVTIDGDGFTSDVEVLFGQASSPLITFVSSKQLKAVVPRGAVADLVDVVVYNKNGVSTQRRAYRYDAPVRITTVAPLTGPVDGGTSLTLTGAGFTGATEVHLGTSTATFSIDSDTQLSVTTPAATAPGAVDVSVVTPHGTWTMKNGFAYVDGAGSFAVFAITPHVLREGDIVHLVGQGLDQLTSVTIGGVTASLDGGTFSTVELTVPTRGAAARKSDVVATGPTTVTLAAAATWRLALTGLAPAVGPTAGGTTATVTGSALPTDAEVFVGALKATVNAVTTETSVDFVTPRGSGGVASDVWAREAADLENEATLTQAFTYLEPLTVGRVQPERGAIAGATLVTVLGSGFGDATTVSFGANKAKDVKVIDSHTLTCRTPKGDVGTVDVKVERLIEHDTLPGGFSYFDPRSISGGLSGGPLVGTLNVTVLDSTQGQYGAPVPQAMVMLGLDSSTPFQGLTDARGQITFSDPSLVKAQLVTVYKQNYQSTSVSSVNAENLTVFVSLTGGGSGSPGQPPPGVPPSTISGRVTGFKSPRPLSSNESLEARVFVAQTSLYSGPPFGGLPNKSREKWKITSDGGEYLVFTGAGLRATYAVLGIMNASTQVFTPVTLGVRRGITTSPDNPATNEDIVLDMQLDLTVPITIDSPLLFPGTSGPPVPGTNRVYAWLDLGAEGFVPNPDNWATGTSGSSSVSSAGATMSFPHFPQLDGSSFVFLNESSGASSYPVSYFFRRQPGDLHQGVTIGPMLPTPNLTAPTTTFGGTISWTVDVGPAPDIHDVQILRPTPFGNVTVWEVMMPGSETQVQLPDVAVEKLRLEEAGNSLFAVIYSSRSPKFAYNQWTYDSLGALAWSSFTITVTPSFTP